MVRFKNRWLLVEFLQPDQLQPTIASSSSSSTSIQSSILQLTGLPSDSLVVEDDHNDHDDDDDNDDPNLPYPSSSTIPFLAPNQPIFLSPQAQNHHHSQTQHSSTAAAAAIAINSGDTPGRSIPEKQIYHAIKRSVLDVFGSQGWGKIGNSFAVKYFSQTTSLCIMRVARDHLRTLWGGITFLTRIDGIRVVPRVIATSGTLKKLYKHAHGYTTLLIASYLSHTLSFLPPPSASASVPEPSSLPSSAPTRTSLTASGPSPPNPNPAQSDRIRRAEVDAWRKRREDVLLGLRGVEEG